MRLLSNPFSRHCSDFLSVPRGPPRYVLASFFVLYFLLIQYCRTHFYRDPTSGFFDPSRGYQPIYSVFRTTQATRFIERIESVAGSDARSENGAFASQTDRLEGSGGKTNASLCVGIASVARDKFNYIESAIGSLLVDLSLQEREDIYLVVFIPHTNPKVHPSYSSNWLYALADRVLFYDLDDDERARIKKLERKGSLLREKGLYDYTYLLKACQAVGTPYIAMVEDDVIALDGWYHRTKHALDAAEKQTLQLGASKYLYLRLFYTHKFLGWNNEESYLYVFGSVAAIVSVWATLTISRRYLAHTQFRRVLSTETITILCLVCTPLCIILFFVAGRASMLPIPAGVHQMPRFGCCAQAMVYPRQRVADIISWYETKQDGYADALLEQYANVHNEVRWALTPSPFQHIGIKSSKHGKSGKRRTAKSIRNLEFELNDPLELQIEHEREIAVRAAEATGRSKGS